MVAGDDAAAINLNLVGPNNADIPDDDDDIDFSDIYARYAVERPKAFDCIVAVDNVPILSDNNKKQKLLKVIKGVFANLGKIVDVHMPEDPETNKTKGFLFMEFEKPDQAANAVKYGDGHQLDVSHTFAVNKFEDFEFYKDYPDAYAPKKTEPFKQRPHLKWWLLDEKFRDQFAVIKGDEVSVVWNNKSEQPDKIQSRPVCPAWDPRVGIHTDLVPFRTGVALWSGPEFADKIRFAHSNVRLIDFSPDEKYLVTWSHEPFTTETGDLHHVIIWDIQTGAKMRTFAVDPSQYQNEGNKGPAATVKIDWPLFKWSHDSKFFARIVPGKEGAIFVYETPRMGLVDKKSIKVDNLRAFDWSPGDNYLSYWTAEVGEIPARVTVMKLPSKEIIRTKNLFGVLSVGLHWQSEGKYLIIKVERAKSKKQTQMNLEVLRIKEKGVPVDLVELAANETHASVFWEPKGDKFAIIASEGPGAPRMSVHFYQMNAPAPPPDPKASKKKPSAASTGGGGLEGGAAVSFDVGGAKLLKSLDRKGFNQVIWSPTGRVAVLAGVREYQGDIEFWDTEDMILLGSGEHFKCTDAEWDPSGRYLVTSVSWWRVQTDPGFTMWSNTGAVITRQTVQQFKQFVWRPRPPTLLPAEKQAAIRKGWKKFSSEFDRIDASQTQRVNREVYERRVALWNEWVAYRRRCQDDWAKEAPLRIDIVGFDLEEDARQGVRELEETVDEIIEEIEAPIEEDPDDFD
ncbi:Translation initiation factor 3 subunit b [Cladochytrium tenue]|nr:Translation initiation factor 3 subunit b [Cladochytrium tenue]